MSYTIRIRNAATVQEFVIPGVRLDWRAYRTDDNQTMLVIEGVEIGPIPGGPCDYLAMEVLTKAGKNYSPATDINIDINGNYTNVYTGDLLVRHLPALPHPQQFVPLGPTCQPIPQWVCEADDQLAFNVLAAKAECSVKVIGSKAARYVAVVSLDTTAQYRYPYPQGATHATYVGGVQINVTEFPSPSTGESVRAFLKSLSPEKVDAFVHAANHRALFGVGFNYITLGCMIIEVEPSSPDVGDEVTKDQPE